MGNHLLNMKEMLSKETSDFSMSLNIFTNPQERLNVIKFGPNLHNCYWVAECYYIRWTAIKSKCASVKLGGNLGAMISTKPEPVNIILNTRQPVTVMQIWSKLYHI